LHTRASLAISWLAMLSAQARVCAREHPGEEVALFFTIVKFTSDQVHAPRGPFRSHDAGQIRAAALAGLGLAHTPKWLFDDALADGRVVEVLAKFAPMPIPVSLAFSTRRLPTKVRVLADFLAEAIRDQAERLY
jgi:DNA-binding transcriptional LysR family regulator